MLFKEHIFLRTISISIGCSNKSAKRVEKFLNDYMAAVYLYWIGSIW